MMSQYETRRLIAGFRLTQKKSNVVLWFGTIQNELRVMSN